MRGPDENNTGVGSRANHAAHAFSGVVEEGPPPGVQWPGFVDFSGTTNGSEPGGGDDAGRPQDVQVVLRRVESSHRMTSLDELGWELPHRFVSPLIAGCLHPHPARKHSTQSVESSAVNLWFLWLLPLPTLHPAPPCTLVLSPFPCKRQPGRYGIPQPGLYHDFPQTQYSLRALHFLPSHHLSFHLPLIARRRPCLGCECRHGWCLFLYIKRQFPPFSYTPPHPTLHLTRRSRRSIAV